MADLGAKLADDEIAKAEKELKYIYNKAYKEILQKQKDFNAAYAAKEAIHLQDVQNGKWTQDEFDAWKAGQVFQGKQWESKKKQILNTVYNANSIATDMINGKTKNVFAFNANYTAYNLEHGAGVNFGFGLYDEATVINLIKNDPQLLPEWKIDQPKDYTWNQKKLKRQINLGIVEGESLDKIATRLTDSLCTQNFNKMRTFARTAMTGAQNSGRQTRLDEAKKLGINVKKEWLATLDAHTRMTHRKLDGQKVDLEKSFEINGMSIRFPGDPLAPAALVYNCRCTMVGDLVNYPSTYNRYDNIDGKKIKNMTYAEWEEAKKKGEDISPISPTFSQIGLYKQSEELLNLFKDKKMSNVYADIKKLNVTQGNKFYKELQGMGKPSEVWSQYINGTLPDEQLEKIDGMLQDYADKAGLLETPLVEQFKNKKMSHVYSDLKAINTTTANKFYKELQNMGKPSDVWQQYLDGKLPKDQAAKIESYLKLYDPNATITSTGKTVTKAKATTATTTTATAATTTASSVKDLFGDKIFDLPPEIGLDVFNICYVNDANTPWDKQWQMYKAGTLSKDATEKIDALLTKYAKDHGLIKNVATVAAKTSATTIDAASSIKNIKNITTLDEAQKTLKDIQEEINKAGANKTFVDIWKNPVTYADYEDKKDSIQAKKDFYLNQIDKYTNTKFAKLSFASQQISSAQQHLKELEEFEKNGKAYSKLFKTLDEAKQKVKELTPTQTSGKMFSLEAFTEKVKKAAHNFTSKTSADKFHRKYLDSIWDNLTGAEKYGIWEYTRNSNPMNKSLSGYHDNWSRSSYIGPAKTDWGHEDPWRSIPSVFKKYGRNNKISYHKAITDTTTAIEKSALPEGVMLVRGSDKGGFAGMIEGDVFTFDQAKKLLDGDIKNIKKALEGQVIQNHAFTSTGIASGTGFGGDIAYRIYAPKGTKAIYAEPQSYFGDTVGANATLYKKGQSYSGVGGEAEVILQRGTEFRITNISQSGYTTIVEMEVIAQPDYFKYGDEDTYNAGKTRHKK